MQVLLARLSAPSASAGSLTLASKVTVTVHFLIYYGSIPGIHDLSSLDTPVMQVPLVSAPTQCHVPTRNQDIMYLIKTSPGHNPLIRTMNRCEMASCGDL